MLHTFGSSVVGPYHTLVGQPCQDAYSFATTHLRGMPCAVAAVADGVGSEAHADVASRVAVDKVVSVMAHLLEGVPAAQGGDVVPRLLRTAFVRAQKAVEEAAAGADGDLSQYDTTLDVAVLCGGTLWYGHVGDSGIVAFTDDGSFLPVTQPQRDDQGGLFPLRCRAAWQFGKFPERCLSVLLATDGVLFSILEPPELLGEVYAAAASRLADPRVLGLGSATPPDDASLSEAVGALMSSLEPEQVCDDRTLLVVVDDEGPTTRQPDSYYDVPSCMRESLDKATCEQADVG